MKQIEAMLAKSRMDLLSSAHFMSWNSYVHGLSTAKLHDFQFKLLHIRAYAQQIARVVFLHNKDVRM